MSRKTNGSELLLLWLWLLSINLATLLSNLCSPTSTWVSPPPTTTHEHYESQHAPLSLSLSLYTHTHTLGSSKDSTNSVSLKNKPLPSNSPTTRLSAAMASMGGRVCRTVDKAKDPAKKKRGIHWGVWNRKESLSVLISPRGVWRAKRDVVDWMPKVGVVVKAWTLPLLLDKNNKNMNDKENNDSMLLMETTERFLLLCGDEECCCCCFIIVIKMVKLPMCDAVSCRRCCCLDTCAVLVGSSMG